MAPATIGFFAAAAEAGSDWHREALEATSYRIEGDMLLQSASYKEAGRKLRPAAKLIAGAEDRTEGKRIKAMADEAAAALDPSHWRTEPSTRGGGHRWNTASPSSG